MKPIKNPQTNEDKLQNFLISLDPIESAILRERILHILKISVEAWEANPKAWYNPFYNISYMKSISNKAIKHMNLDY